MAKISDAEIRQLLMATSSNEVEDPSLLQSVAKPEAEKCKHNCKLCKICGDFNTPLKESAEKSPLIRSFLTTETGLDKMITELITGNSDVNQADIVQEK